MGIAQIVWRLSGQGIGHFQRYHSTVCPYKIFLKHCLHFFLGLTLVPGENKVDTYAKFWRDKQRVLWYFFKVAYQLSNSGSVLLRRVGIEPDKSLNEAEKECAVKTFDFTSYLYQFKTCLILLKGTRPKTRYQIA